MSTSALMGISVRALKANYAALQATGHNIANANVDGYSRQQVELATSPGQFTGAGYFGKGVDVKTVSRSHSEFLTRESNLSTSLAALDETRKTQLQQLEKVFPPGEQGLGYATGQFLNSMVDLSSMPSDSATRQVVLARAGDLAERFANAGRQLDELQFGVSEDLRNSIETLNGLAQGVANVNQKIASLQGLGQPANDLLDERDRLIAGISKLLQVSTVPAEDGTVGVFFGGGQQLVLSNQAMTVSAIPDPADPSRTALGLSDGAHMRTVQADALGGGSISGLLRFQNHDLVDARAMLGQMAAVLSQSVNQQQALGLDLGNPVGAGVPIFATGSPLALPAATNARDGGGNFAATVSLQIIDATQLQASEYDLRASPDGVAGEWQLTRLSDGLVRTIASGEQVDGMQVDIDDSGLGATDRFLLQPVSRAANGMQRVLDNPQGIAAASPLTAVLGTTNKGTASIAELRVVSSAVDPQLKTTITFNSATGDYDWELADRDTGDVIDGGSATWVPGQPISLNGYELRLSGVPRSGDVITVDKTLYPAASNGNAKALLGLRDRPLVGRMLQDDGSFTGGATLTNAYAATMANIGVRVQGAVSAADVSAQVAQQAELTRTSVAGVNLDEEAARLIQYQQSYQAAAKVLQTAQQVFDTMLNAVAR